MTFALVKSQSRLLTALNLLPSMAKENVQAFVFNTDGGACADVVPTAGRSLSPRNSRLPEYDGAICYARFDT